MEIFGLPLSAVLSQLLLGLVNGSFYAVLSLGLAVIFGLLNVVNFAHGAMFMMGAVFTWMAFTFFGIGYWPMLILAPLLVAVVGVLIEKFLLKYLYQLDHLYGLLLTFGLTLILEGVFRSFFGVSGMAYSVPDSLAGAVDVGFMFLPIMGSIFTGLGLGIIEAITKVIYPEASSTVVFLVMALVLLVRPAGLFGREK